MTLPTAQFRRETTAAPRGSLIWRARDLSVDAATGHAGSLTRAATGTSDDSAAVSLTTVRDRPRWHITSGLAALRAGTSDYLTWTLNLVPVTMCGLLDFVEQGPTASSGALYLGNDAASGARMFIDVSAGMYRLYHHNGTTAVASTMVTAPTAGQRCQLRWWLYSTGSVQLWQSIAGAAETTPGASAVNALTTAWADTKFRLNCKGTTAQGARDYLGCVVLQGNQTQATLLQALSY